jgi:polysaccharide deacetylase family protein (PEP-CTERM system associated)
MDHDASSPLCKSAVILAVVSVVAATSNLIFGRALHIEPLGLLSFGLFCLGYGMIIPFLSRSRQLKETAISTDHMVTPEQGGPVMVRDQRPRPIQLPELRARPCHALTIDLEDYFHTEVASQGISFSDWEQQPSRIEASTHRLLELLDGSQTRATFFVLGWVAKRYPRLIHEIHQRGHEIGCHSLDHRLVCRMKPAEFYETTHQAKSLIEDIIDEPIRGYRAPCFSITPGCEWAFDSLVRLGFAYDSSVHPVNHPLYGNPTAPRAAYAVAQGRLMEFPIATWKVAGRNLSVGGGAYLRLLPYQYIHRGLIAWEKEMQTPAMLYLHPWEIDPYQPYIPLSFQSKIRQTWGTTTMETKLRQLLSQFSFAPVREVHKNILEDKGYQPTKSAFQHAEAVEQVAG